MGKTDYRYSTAEMAAYYGLSRKGLAFYEEKGIVEPSRTENNKYRVFTLAECYNLYSSKLYDNCAFTLKETVAALKAESMGDAARQIDEKLDQMERDIAIKQMTLAHGRRITALIKRAERGPWFETTMSPACYRLFVRRYYDEHTFTPEASREFAQWNSTVPINTASLKYDLRDILSGDAPVNVDIGNIINEQAFDALGYQQSERVEFLPPRRCLYTVLIGDGNQIDRRTWLEPALAHMAAHGLTPSGDPFTSMLLIRNTDRGILRYDEAWLPVEGDGV